MGLTEKWVAALRSGEYQQGTRRLCRNNRFCVLGVLCDILDLPYTQGRGSRYYEGQSEILTEEARLAVGLRTKRGDFGNTCLSKLNDDGVSFLELADIIESKPDGLFDS